MIPLEGHNDREGHFAFYIKGYIYSSYSKGENGHEHVANGLFVLS